MKAPTISDAISIAETAGAEALRHFRGKLGIEFKADESPVTQADRAVEAAVRRVISEKFPNHGIFGEEFGVEGEGRSKMWIVDPIDGTRSFLSGHPLFGFLLGHLVDGVPDMGVVGMPATGEIFAGAKGQGATLNGKPIRVSKQTDLKKAILYINEGERIYKALPVVFDRLMNAGQTRRMSYDCYPHALLAAGYIDALVDFGLEPYDHLPVTALIEAAGGIITDWQGDSMTMNSEGRIVAAATPELHAELLKLVSE